MIALLGTGVLITFIALAHYTGFGFRLKFDANRSKAFIGFVTYAVSLVTVTLFTFLAVMVIAGPHTGMLEPGFYTQLTFVAGFAVVMVVPLLAVNAALKRRN